MTRPLSLSVVYAGWGRSNQLLAEAIAPLPPEQLSLSAAGLGTIEQLVAHIVANRAYWFCELMGETWPEMDRWARFHDDNTVARPLASLLDGLAATWAMIEGVLAAHTTADLEESFERELRGKMRTLTRQFVTFRVLNHDIHHGGEISLTLGMHGLPGLAF